MPLHPLFAFFLSCVARFSVLLCLGNSRELQKKRKTLSVSLFVALALFFSHSAREEETAGGKQ